MRQILTTEDRDQLAHLIGDIETRTAGELVLVVARRSGSYGTTRVTWAAVASLVVVTLVELVYPSLPPLWLLGLQGPVGLVLWWLLGHPEILRRVVPRDDQQRRVSDRVKQLFIERGITETRDRSGVLIFLSELERRVEILADRGIHERVGSQAWAVMVDGLVTEIRAGKASSGLSAILRRIGDTLAAHFPPRPDDTNELPDAVVEVDR